MPQSACTRSRMPTILRATRKLALRRPWVSRARHRSGAACSRHSCSVPHSGRAACGRRERARRLRRWASISRRRWTASSRSQARTIPIILAGLALLLLFGNNRIRARHRKSADGQLAADAARLHRHRAVAGLRLHDLRRPAQFHQRAAAVRIHLVRHPGRDADRGLADRREFCRRHEPAHGGRPAHAAGRCQRRHAARRGVRRPRLLLDAPPVRRGEPHQHRRSRRTWCGSPTYPSTSCWRWCCWRCSRSASGAAATSPRPTCKACA